MRVCLRVLFFGNNEITGYQGGKNDDEENPELKEIASIDLYKYIRSEIEAL